MAAYRFESSPSNRAGCSNPECKSEKVKIKKDELRVGSWINTEKIQTWSWRHWGCTTPKIIQNIINAWNEMQNDPEEKDYSLLDGYEELSEEYQAKVRKALEQGHVDDEDWSGDLEMNRPGRVGFRVRGGKKADTQTKNDENTSPKKKSTAAKKADDTDEDSAAEKEESNGKPADGTDEAPQEEAAKEAPKKRGPGRPRKDGTTKPTPTETAKKGTNKQGEGASRGRRAKASTTGPASPETKKQGAKRKIDSDNEEEHVPKREKPKRGRPGRPRKSEKTQAEEAETGTSEPPKRGRKPAQKK